RVPAGLRIAARGAAHQRVAARGAFAVFTEDNYVDRLLRADVVTGSAQNADAGVIVMHRVALEAANGLHDGLAIRPWLLHLGHVITLGRLEDRRIGAREGLRLAVVVGALDDGLVEAAVVRLHVLAEVLA